MVDYLRAHLCVLPYRQSALLVATQPLQAMKILKSAILFAFFFAAFFRHDFEVYTDCSYTVGRQPANLWPPSFLHVVTTQLAECPDADQWGLSCQDGL